MLGRKLRYLFFFFLFLVLIWFFAGIGFCWVISKKQSQSDLPVDAVIVFTGDKNRIKQAFMLMKDGKAKKMLISGVGVGVKIDDFKNLAKESQVELDKVTLGELAQNTYDNALESKIFMDLNGFKTAYLVTSNYHIPRSMLYLDNIMPGYEIKPVYNRNHVDLKYIAKAFAEYNKLLASHYLVLEEDYYGRYQMFIRRIFYAYIKPYTDPYFNNKKKV